MLDIRPVRVRTVPISPYPLFLRKVIRAGNTLSGADIGQYRLSRGAIYIFPKDRVLRISPTYFRPYAYFCISTRFRACPFLADYAHGVRVSGRGRTNGLCQNGRPPCPRGPGGVVRGRSWGGQAAEMADCRLGRWTTADCDAGRLPTATKDDCRLRRRTTLARTNRLMLTGSRDDVG